MRRPILALLVPLALHACDCSGGDGLGGLKPKIVVTPDPVDFDTVPVGTTASVRVVVANAGDIRLALASVTLSGDPGFALAELPTLPLELGQMQSTAFEVRYTASMRANADAKLTFASDDRDRPALEVPVRARRRTGPVLVVCRSSLEIPLASACGEAPAIPFGTVGVGDARRATIELRSEGTDPVVLTGGLALAAGSSEFFSATGTVAGTLTLRPGERHVLNVAFGPKAEGAAAARVELASNDAARPARTLLLDGAGGPRGLCVAPNPLDFGIVGLGQSKEATLEVSNCGTEDIRIDGAEILGAGPFTITTTLSRSITLPPIEGIRYAIKVRFAPRVEADHTARLRVKGSTGDALVTLTGQARGCYLVASPNQLSFSFAEGVFDKRVVVENAGGERCVIDKIYVAETREFGVDFFENPGGEPGFPLELMPGSSVLARVYFQPVSDRVEDRLVIDYAGRGGPRQETVTLLGSAQGQFEECQLSVAPNPVNFGAVPPGQARTQGLALSALGNSRCIIDRVEIAAGGDEGFTARIDGELRLTPGMSGVATIGFRPTTAGRKTATIRVHTDSPTTPIVEVPVSGFADVPSLCVTPANIDFGNVATEASAEVTLFACAARAVDVTSLAFVAPDAELELLDVPALPVSLAAGETRRVRVRYRPADADGDTVIVRVGSTDPGHPTSDVRVTGGPEIVPPSAGRWLYYWQIDLTGGRGLAEPAPGLALPGGNGESSIVRMPLQGALVAENFWGPPSGKPCAGCHTVSPDGRFVALAEFGATQSVKLVDKLTRTEVLLSHTLTDATFLAWNPDVNAGDGWQYVYSDGMDLHVASIGGGYAGKLVGADTPERMESMPTWLPDGSIVFTRFDNPGGIGTIGGSGPAQLYRIAPGAARAEPLIPLTATPTAARYYPRVSPDGRWIAYTESVEVNNGRGTISAPDARVRLVSADGRSHVSLTPANGAGDGGSSYPTWSADGRFLSFASNRSGGRGSWDLYLTPVDPVTGAAAAASNIEALNTPDFEHAVHWSP
jgi:hypothetical protein